MTTAPDSRSEQGSFESVVTAVKPHLRGWLHAGMVPLALAAGIVLIALAPTTSGRIAAVVFSVTAWLLFGTSAVYHRGNWSPRVARILKRMDHSNIFLIIAGTYTPFALLLPRNDARTMLLIVWLGAIAGVLFRVFWVGAPRGLYTPVYVALVYGIKRPNPSPRWFGFHEIFHTLTVAAFTVHYIAASMTVYGAGSAS